MLTSGLDSSHARATAACVVSRRFAIFPVTSSRFQKRSLSYFLYVSCHELSLDPSGGLWPRWYLPDKNPLASGPHTSVPRPNARHAGTTSRSASRTASDH